MRARTVFLSLIAAVSIVSVSLFARSSRAAEKPVDAAAKAAQSWLALVDAGKYGESWDAAAAYFRGAVSKEKWSEMAAGVRPPLGAVASRKLKSAKLTTTLPGAPDGQYVVIQFATSFANKKSAVETVTPTLEADGTWKVSGYFVK